MFVRLVAGESSPKISHWNADNGYEVGVDDNKYPRRISNSLPFGALRLRVVQSKRNVPFKCTNKKKSAFRIYLPGEMQISKSPIQIYNIIQKRQRY